MNEHFLTDIEIKQFKCFTDFKASGFKRVNLIGGKNNIGKTALMEACHINTHSFSINTMLRAIYAIKFRREKVNLVFENALSMIQDMLDFTKNYSSKSNLGNKEFSIIEKDGIKEYKFNINNSLKVINAKELSITFHIINNIRFIDSFGWSDSELAEAYQVIQRQDKEIELNKFINSFDNDIQNFKTIGDKPQCKVNNEYIDITEFGDGLKHYISIICALYECENGYLFIDEIDNGIYYDHFDRLWEIVLTLSKETNCQVFATTHSKEMLEAFARVAEKLGKEDIAHQDISYTLLVKNKKQELTTISLNYQDIIESLITHDFEVR